MCTGGSLIYGEIMLPLLRSVSIYTFDALGLTLAPFNWNHQGTLPDVTMDPKANSKEKQPASLSHLKISAL